MSNRVFVLGAEKQPLMPCHPARARELLGKGKASVFRRYPFTIILKERVGGEIQPVQVKVDPGSKVTGMAIVTDRARGKAVVFAAEIEHRGGQVKAALGSRKTIRRSRRNRKTRYRKPRFDNRTRKPGWLPPSLQSRIENVITWVRRFSRLVPVVAISQELVRFDTQAMLDPEISGIEYQQGTLLGYEVREYLLEKFRRTCVYCKRTDISLQIEHIHPKSRGGSDRIDNLTLACERCNTKKGNKTAKEFGYPEVQGQVEMPLRDAATVNATRWELYRRLGEFGYPIECGTGGRTKFNRVRQGYQKAHWIDAACVGVSGEIVRLNPASSILMIKATGHGNRRMCGTDKYGFPIRHRTNKKVHFGFQTGDMVRAKIPSGKYSGIYVGRIVVRSNPWFRLGTFNVHPRHLINIFRSNGYSYKFST